MHEIHGNYIQFTSYNYKSLANCPIKTSQAFNDISNILLCMKLCTHSSFLNAFTRQVSIFKAVKMWTIIADFLDTSGVHGFNYIHPRNSIISRIFWVSQLELQNSTF